MQLQKSENIFLCSVTSSIYFIIRLIPTTTITKKNILVYGEQVLVCRKNKLQTQIISWPQLPNNKYHDVNNVKKTKRLSSYLGAGWRMLRIHLVGSNLNMRNQGRIYRWSPPWFPFLLWRVSWSLLIKLCQNQCKNICQVELSSSLWSER